MSSSPEKVIGGAGSEAKVKPMADLLKDLEEKEARLQTAYDNLVNMHRERVSQYEKFMDSYNKLKDASLNSSSSKA